MNAEQKTIDLELADAKAAKRDHERHVCDMCRGAGVARTPDMNSQGHVRVKDPCPQCEGHGVIWLPKQSDPAIPRPRGMMNYSEAMALPDD